VGAAGVKLWTPLAQKSLYQTNAGILGNFAAFRNKKHIKQLKNRHLKHYFTRLWNIIITIAGFAY
jgi:hypothetical protein